VQLPEDAGAALDQRLDLEVLLPHAAVAQVLRQPGAEEIGRLEDVAVGGDDEVLLRHAVRPPDATAPAGGNHVLDLRERVSRG
jgi:hypothetical protein